MKYQLKINKFGSNQYGSWVLGQITNGVVCYNGLFRIRFATDEQELSDNMIVNVKNIIISYNEKKSKYAIVVIL